MYPVNEIIWLTDWQIITIALEISDLSVNVYQREWDWGFHCAIVVSRVRQTYINYKHSQARAFTNEVYLDHIKVYMDRVNLNWFNERC